MRLSICPVRRDAGREEKSPAGLLGVKKPSFYSKLLPAVGTNKSFAGQYQFSECIFDRSEKYVQAGI